MVVVLIPPLATHAINLVSPRNVTSPLDTCWRHRRESRIALEESASKIPWQTEYSSHRTVTCELPPTYGSGPDWIAVFARNRVESRTERNPPLESRGCELPRESRGVGRAQTLWSVVHDVPTAVPSRAHRSVRATPVVGARRGLADLPLWEMSNPLISRPHLSPVRTDSPGGIFVHHSPKVPSLRLWRPHDDETRARHASPVRMRPFREPRGPAESGTPPPNPPGVPGREAAWTAIQERFSGIFAEPYELPLSPGRALSPMPRDFREEIHRSSASSSALGAYEWRCHLPSAPSPIFSESAEPET